MRVRDLIAHLQKLNPEAEILPLWEMHCPGDFGGFVRATDEGRKLDAPEASELIYLECDDPPADIASWDLPR